MASPLHLSPSAHSSALHRLLCPSPLLAAYSRLLACCPSEWTVSKRFSAFSKLRDDLLTKAAEADARTRRSSVGVATPTMKRGKLVGTSGEYQARQQRHGDDEQGEEEIAVTRSRSESAPSLMSSLSSSGGVAGPLQRAVETEAAALESNTGSENAIKQKPPARSHARVPSEASSEATSDLFGRDSSESESDVFRGTSDSEAGTPQRLKVKLQAPRYTCQKKSIVRDSAAMDSGRVGVLQVGTILSSLEETTIEGAEGQPVMRASKL